MRQPSIQVAVAVRDLFLSLLLVWAFAPTAPAQKVEVEEGAVITVDVQVVNVLVTVRDKNGLLATELTQDDFEIYEDGRQQEIRYFAAESDLPLTIGLLVDTSVSQERLIDIERSAGYQFFDKVLRMDKDLAFLMSFDTNVELLQDLTDSKHLLGDGLDKLQIQGAPIGVTPGTIPGSSKPVGTAMYDGVYLAAAEMLRPQVGRKAIVLISDGNDYGSRIEIDEAIAEAHKSDMIIYAVRYFDREFYFRSGALGGDGNRALKKLAQATGGGVYEVSRKHTLDSILDEINGEVRSQYSIGFSPTHDTSEAGFRKLEVRVKPKGYKVQAREGYYPSAP